MPHAVPLHVNGQAVTVSVDDPDMPVLFVLRNELDLHGPRFGCGIGQCGACTVHVDGDAVRSCLIPLSALSPSQKVVTLEGLGALADLSRMQKAFIDAQAVRCGSCINGIIMGSAALLAKMPRPSPAQVHAALASHLCRCGSHARIMRALRRFL